MTTRWASRYFSRLFCWFNKYSLRCDAPGWTWGLLSDADDSLENVLIYHRNPHLSYEQCIKYEFNKLWELENNFCDAGLLTTLCFELDQPEALDAAGCMLFNLNYVSKIAIKVSAVMSTLNYVLRASIYTVHIYLIEKTFVLCRFKTRLLLIDGIYYNEWWYGNPQ